MPSPAILASAALLLTPALLSTASAQLHPDTVAIAHMRADVRFLASDALEGREAGSPGEKLAADHVAARFTAIGLQPHGDEGTYLQAFTFNAEPELGEANRMNIGRSLLQLGDQFFPLEFSASAGVRGKLLDIGFGIHAPELGQDDYAEVSLKDRIAVINIGSPDGIHPHSKYLAHHDLAGRAAMAASRGAVAVIFHNDDPNVEEPGSRLSAKAQPGTVPVVFVKGADLKPLLIDNNPCVINTDIRRPQRTAYNVVGFHDNGAAHTVVIGAHFDHLGWGDEGSMHRGERAIHNGADDNASGVAAMLQLATDLTKDEQVRNNNYLFIAFSGEEKGLYGSNYWTKHPTVPIAQLNYMINLDMVGRYDAAKGVAINGMGTSPAWAAVDSLPVAGLQPKLSNSGVGPSDHTSFYLQGVPAVHFFTGTHADYHKPSDDEPLINYDGMLRIVRYIEAMVRELDDDGKLVFTKTEEANAESTPRFKVTLGVVPDYLYDGKGMRIDGVTEGKPAAAAGLKAGDIVTRVGSVEVIDMMSYMKGLGAFNKGDKATVTWLREGKEMKAEVTF
jgi:aminopeptidase YwaD